MTHGSWKNPKTANGYIENSVAYKKRTENMITSLVNDFSTTAVLPTSSTSTAVVPTPSSSKSVVPTPFNTPSSSTAVVPTPFILLVYLQLFLLLSTKLFQPIHLIHFHLPPMKAWKTLFLILKPQTYVYLPHLKIMSILFRLRLEYRRVKI